MVSGPYRRSASDKKIAGVCGGFASYLGWDPFWVRVLWFLLTLASVGTMVLIYLVIWWLADEA